MTTSTPRSPQRQSSRAKSSTVSARLLSVARQLTFGAALSVRGLSWIMASVIALGAATAGHAYGQPTLEFQQEFTVTSRSGVIDNFRLIAGRLTLQNLSNQTITGPVTLMLENLNPAISLNGATGSTSGGTPYINLPASIRFAPREPVVLNLIFKLPSRIGSPSTVSFKARLILTPHRVPP